VKTGSRRPLGPGAEAVACPGRRGAGPWQSELDEVLDGRKPGCKAYEIGATHSIRRFGEADEIEAPQARLEICPLKCAAEVRGLDRTHARGWRPAP